MEYLLVILITYSPGVTMKITAPFESFAECTDARREFIGSDPFPEALGIDVRECADQAKAAGMKERGHHT